ncbi:MAG: Alcohol dehydrogenase 2 [Phycisphaerae bacterium]|nr:Alcohol dehydrogenase 2 [Phycisphaerae bacterium]
MRLTPDPRPVEVPGSRVRVVFGAGMLARLGQLADGLLPRVAGDPERRVLLVTDPGLRDSGHVGRALAALAGAGLAAEVFDGVHENPTGDDVSAGAEFARSRRPGLIVGLGGGSAMDAAKGVNLLLTNGGTMSDYEGYGKARRPMLPLIAVPTSAGTGSEAQSYALISDPATHRKMACGDPKAQPRVALLDPDLTATAPPHVAAAAGIDAIAHAAESSATTRRTDVSRRLSRWAWELLAPAFPRSMGPSAADQARADMLLGAHLAGAAIENSMLGAAHALANPLTARFGVTHGQAVGLMLPHVVRFNALEENPYSDLEAEGGALADRLDEFLAQAGLAGRLRDLAVDRAVLADLAEMAAGQWTARFNPRPVGKAELEALYRSAW